jgi:hypothetical protein
MLTIENIIKLLRQRSHEIFKDARKGFQLKHDSNLEMIRARDRSCVYSL